MTEYYSNYFEVIVNRKQLLLLDYLLNNIRTLTNMPLSLELASQVKEMTSKHLSRSEMNMQANENLAKLKELLEAVKGIVDFGDKFESLAQKKGETMKTHASAWKDVAIMVIQDELVHDKDYFIRWLDSEGKYSPPRLATWDDDDKAFFAFDELRSWPLQATQCMEIPA